MFNLFGDSESQQYAQAVLIFFVRCQHKYVNKHEPQQACGLMSVRSFLLEWPSLLID